MKRLLICSIAAFALIVGGCKDQSGQSNQNTTSENQTEDQSQDSSDSKSDSLTMVENPGDNWGTVKGMVKLSGSAPRLNPEGVSSTHQQKCDIDSDRTTKQVLKVNKDSKAVKDAVVYIKGLKKGLKSELPPKEVTIDQKGCRFHPNHAIVRKGGTLKVTNGDPTTHNFRYEGLTNSLFKGDKNQGEGAEALSIKMNVLDAVKFGCNVHPWMGGMVRTANHHAYALTGKDGSFSFQVPPGDYTLVVRHYLHPAKKPYTTDITVKEGGTVEKTVEIGLSQ